MANGTTTLAADLMVFLSNQPDELARFFAVTGADPGSVRDMLADPGFQSGMLDYLVGNESLLLAFCEETGHSPTRISALAREDGHWM